MGLEKKRSSDFVLFEVRIHWSILRREVTELNLHKKSL